MMGSIHPPRLPSGLLLGLLFTAGLSCTPQERIVVGPPAASTSPPRPAAAAGSAAQPRPGYDPRSIAEGSKATLVLPMVVRPTARSATVHVVAPGSLPDLRLAYRLIPHESSSTAATTAGSHVSGELWLGANTMRSIGGDAAEWVLTGLEPGQRYAYRLSAADGTAIGGTFVTQRPAGSAFTFALISDPHVFIRDFSREELAAVALPAGDVERHGGLDQALRVRQAERAHAHAILPRVADNVLAERPDFVINLGDTIDLHGFGFNVPLPSRRWVRKGYLDYRWLLGPLARNASHFAVMGNWDGEKGCFTPEQRERARSQRLIYLPNPTPKTYPQGGSAHQDYYAFRWGDALFVVLNVISYTSTEHVLQQPARPDDFTLGPDQLAWLEQTLAQATSRWRFLFLHHVVGGRGGDERNSSYGRGGGRAAKVGEQAKVHALMRKHTVAALFYGHDHVFYDMTVDGIHYTLPGSAGAPWKFTTAETGYDEYWPDSGHARINVRPAVVEVEFVSVERRVLHRFTIAPPTPP